MAAPTAISIPNANTDNINLITLIKIPPNIVFISLILKGDFYVDIT